MVTAIKQEVGGGARSQQLRLTYYAYFLLCSTGCQMTRKELYLDMFDTTAYKLAWLVQIP